MAGVLLPQVLTTDVKIPISFIFFKIYTHVFFIKIFYKDVFVSVRLSEEMSEEEIGL